MFTRQALIVDDEPLMQRCLSESFKRFGFQVFLASNGEEALELFQKNPTKLVISDIKMPCMDGIDLLKQIKIISPATYVILISAYGNVEKAVEALKSGAYDFIEKPFLKDKLENLVTTIINIHALKESNNQDEQVLSDNNHYIPIEEQGKKEIITCSYKMLHLLEICKSVAKTRATVLLHGESGTGKELFANFIHQYSSRNKAPFIDINCAAIPESLLESELFGHEKGAFTGAMNKRRGIFERADKGTLFLDEIGEISLSLQAKLLRVIQEHKLERVGGETSINVDVRIIASTNKNLLHEIKNKNFREDLYYRLNVVRLVLPPLRERKEDIPLLINHFIEKFNKMYEFEIEGVSKDALNNLSEYNWSGNIRELENSIERAVIIKRLGVLNWEDFCLFSDQSSLVKEEIFTNPMPVYDLQKEHIIETLKEFNGNRTKTAKALGLSVRTIRNRIRDYRTVGIEI